MWQEGWQTFLNNYWVIIADHWQMFMGGVWTTFWLVGLSLLLGLIIAVPFGMILASRLPLWAKAFPMAFSYVFRGTPMLVQLYLVYYGIGLQLGDVEAVRGSDYWWPILRQAWPWALLSFTLNTAAYTSEIVRGAIETAPKGEIEAAVAMGMSKGLVARRVVLPNALRRALPAYGNEVIFLLHGSAIASVITIMDITGVARNLYAIYYEPFVPFIAAGVLYLMITTTVVMIFQLVERALSKHLVIRRLS
ncbi:ABC transporter permease subunit [Suttonella sp. R2A3]|uniref:ABC transporter permease n=1 Tax=Suttonella sp. R2A3 TaxID=2908648 RepID=UPI001EEC2709|nr:ABC transporter permease subunit [Suttonella sp. R2A3]UJF24917.1 ABC transporter permease subunit [Suttonella sp. R2A3]